MNKMKARKKIVPIYTEWLKEDKEDGALNNQNLN